MGIGDKVKEFVTGEKKEEEDNWSNAKYGSEVCALCSNQGSDKKWAGQYWHKKCYRKMKGMAKGML